MCRRPLRQIVPHPTPAPTKPSPVPTTNYPTSFDLVDAAAGQKWKIVSPVPAGASISVTTPSGNVTGTIVAGTYKFRLQTQSDSLNCFDEVQVVIQPCGGGGFTDQICYIGVDEPVKVGAKQEWKINPDNTVTIRTTFSKTFVDNTYGSNAIGWPGGHTFNNLVGSDKLELSLKDGNGVEKMVLVFDYIKTTSPTLTFGTGGVTDGVRQSGRRKCVRCSECKDITERKPQYPGLSFLYNQFTANGCQLFSQVRPVPTGFTMCGTR